MGVLSVEPARISTWVGRSAAAAWNAFDVQLAFYALALAVVGLMMAYTNSAQEPLQTGSVFTRGLMWLAIAIVAFTLATLIDYRWLRTFAWPLYAVNLGLLGLTLALGSGIGGVSRWVTIPGLGLQFQFSEIAKVLVAIALADFLATRERRLRSLLTLIGAALLVFPPLALVLVQPDLGTSLVFGAILFGTLFLVGARLRWLIIAAAGVVALVPVAWAVVLKDYQKQRLLSFLDPSADPQGSGYQLLQSQIAVGSGGLFGRGLTNGTQNQLDFLPVQATDFVLATLAEELGFVGVAVVLLLFTALIWRILVVGWRSEDLFGLGFAAAIASMILFQVLVNVGMVLGIMPITGIPLPFVTHGGASLTSVAVALGILQSINMRQGRHDW
jgi:rod shape determining protein RodA